LVGTLLMEQRGVGFSAPRTFVRPTYPATTKMTMGKPYCRNLLDRILRGGVKNARRRGADEMTTTHTFSARRKKAHSAGRIWPVC